MSLLEEKKQNYLQGRLPKQDYIQQMYELHQSLFDYASYLKETDISKIEISDNKVIMTSRAYDIRLVCDARDKRTAPVETLNFGCYEPNESELMMGLLADSKAQVVLDIGANIGWYSLAIAKTFPQSQLYSFEPVPYIYQTFQENVSLNQLKNISLYNSGFSNTSGIATFFVAPELGVNASMRNVANRDKDELIEFNCPISTVDEFVSQERINVDFIKCDVEGAEYLVFQGAKETLQRQQPIIFSELLRKWSARFDYHPNEMLSFLRSLGYQCFVPKQRNLIPFFEMDEETLETNYFFLHGQKHQSLIQKYASPQETKNVVLANA